ncbi:MAG: glycosyltransferase [Gemmatimonadota bacterium]|nr:glycosyltransferase [Gemmatimonadota bacterium]
MDPLVEAMIAWVGIYPLTALALVLGVRRLPRSRAVSNDAAPSVSVVVSARNEARDLPRCIEALLALDYPPQKLQIVLVDDLSDDGTGALVDAVARAHPHVVALHTAALAENGLEAKARGIAHGFAHATGEWVLITDADGKVPRTWVRHLLGEAGPNVTVVSGSVVVEPRRWWGLAERLVNLFLHPINHGVAGWGVPVVAIGPNMGVRRAAYQRVGGLVASPPLVAEDLALYLLATREGGEARCYLDPETTVVLTPVPSPRHLVSQVRRFALGGVAQDWRYALGLTVALSWGTAVMGLVFLGWMISFAPWAAVVGAKIGADALLLGSQARRGGETLRWYEPLLLQPTLLVLVSIVTVSLALRRRIHWRGEGYAVRFD